MQRVVLAGDPVASVAEYIERGGGEGLRAALMLGPWVTAQEVNLSGLRGRGGGGFRTGRKWMSVLESASPSDRRYVVCNGAEGEPGTFKDRAILRHNPYQVIEGLTIAAFVLGARHAFLATKAVFTAELARITTALAEMQAAGLAGEIPITVVEGPDSYLFGEEKALLEVIEGDDPLPRRDPPYVHGLFASDPQLGWNAHDDDLASSGANPTVVNNVETLANVAHIVARGAEWFRCIGTWKSPGTMVFTVVGDVRSPGFGELELGRPLGEVIDSIGGGPLPGRRIKAVFSGVSNGVIKAIDLDAPATYEGLQRIGSGLGSGGFIVYDDTADMVSVARMFSRFLHVESCGQCGACKFNSGAVWEALERFGAGAARPLELERIGVHLEMVTDQGRCYLPQELQTVVGSILRGFPDDFAGSHTGLRREYVLPKIVDLGNGRVRYDDRVNWKRPDWTFLEPPLAS